MVVALIVGSIALVATVLVGVLGYLMDKSGDPAEHEALEESRTLQRRGGSRS